MSILSSIGNGLKKLGLAVAGGLGQIFAGFGSFIHWLTGSFDFGLGLLGIRPEKTLYLKVVILREIDSKSLTIQQEVQDCIDFTKDILKRELNVKLVPVDDEFIETLSVVSPPEVLDASCGTAAWADDFGVAGDFFRMNSAVMFFRSQTGWGSPITAFIVNSVADGNSRGCSLGPLTSYVTISDDRGLIAPETGTAAKTLAHEIGHACDLTQTSGANNLMTPSAEAPTGTTLTHMQKARFRWSRHVSYWV
ncbi:hypothetical protein [Rheinheimera salexigens]|nr:hypothetical protein [Rheinheimera salexigens]